MSKNAWRAIPSPFEGEGKGGGGADGVQLLTIRHFDERRLTLTLTLSLKGEGIGPP